MLGTIGNFLGSVAIYITALLGLVALFFLWVAFREWRTGAQAMFGVERDIATSEMIGALSRAGIVAVVAVLVLGLGWLGQQSESSNNKTARATQAPQSTQPTVPIFPGVTVTPGMGEPAPTLLPTNTSQPEVTGVPQLPQLPTETPLVEPTSQTAFVNNFGGVWLRDTPNGGTIVVLPQNTVVELLEGQQTSGDYEWQQVRVQSNPLGSEAQVGQEGWVALDFLQANP